MIGRCAIPTIAQQMRLDPEVILWWERLFFAVREHESAGGWIGAHVILPESEHNPGLAVRLRVARGSGPGAAQAIIASDAGHTLRPGDNVLGTDIGTTLRLLAAIERPFDSEGANVQLLRRHLESRHREEQLQFARQQHADKTEEAKRKDEIAKERNRVLDRKALREEAQLRSARGTRSKGGGPRA